MEEPRDSEDESLGRKRKSVRCIGVLPPRGTIGVVYPRLIECTTDFKIGIGSYCTVSIKVNNVKEGKSVCVIPGKHSDLLGILHPYSPNQVTDGYIYLDLENTSFIDREIKTGGFISEIEGQDLEEEATKIRGLLMCDNCIMEVRKKDGSTGRCINCAAIRELKPGDGFPPSLIRSVRYGKGYAKTLK